MPFSFAASATRSAAFIAAYGEASSFAAFTTMPPVAFAIVSAPVRSVSVMMMLLYEAYTCAIPHFVTAPHPPDPRVPPGAPRRAPPRAARRAARDVARG